jgi:ABC-type branched-subunit amino acid transport system permease subunit
VIAGFALLIVLHVVLTHWEALTNGPQTLFGVERHTYVVNSAIWASIFVALAYWFKESKVGLQLRASRDDLVSAGSIGVDIVTVRWLALVLSAFAAGLAGGLFAHFITSFTPKAFFLSETFVVLAMLVIGGPATVTGAVLGTVLTLGLQRGLADLSAQGLPPERQAQLDALAAQPEALLARAGEVDPAVLGLFRGALAGALHEVFVVGLGFVLIALLAAFLIPKGKAQDHVYREEQEEL